MSLSKILERANEYVKRPSVVGFEEPFTVFLEGDVPDNNLTYRTDRTKNLVSWGNLNTKNPIVLTAHLDRHGIVYNNDGRFEYAAFTAKKKYRDEITTKEKVFKKAGERYVDESVIAYDPNNGEILGEGVVNDFSYDFRRKDLFYTIDGLQGLEPNTPISLVSRLDVGDTDVSSQVDNAISIAVARQLVDDGFDGIIILSGEEEIGRSWKHITTYLEESDIDTQELIVLDVTPYDTSEPLGSGLVALRNGDEFSEFNSDLVSKIEDLAVQNGIPYEFKDEAIKKDNDKWPPKSPKIKKLGKTELGRIIKETNGAFNGATIQLPTMDRHTNHETFSLAGLQNYYDLLKSITLA